MSARRLFAFVFASLALVAGPSAQATTPGQNGRIVFASTRYGNSDLYSVKADGSDERRLTATADLEQFPAWSPDGSRIAYERFLFSPGRIWVMNADGSGATQISPPAADSANDMQPAWSPDGTLIAFASTRSGTWNIWVMNADGSGLRRVSDVFGSRPAWSPDGRQLAYVGTNGIGVVGLDGSNPHVVSAPGAFADGPSWSPDGTRIVFSRNNPQGYPGELYIARVDGSGEQPLTSDGFENASPSWSPNGTQVVFQRTSFAPEGWKLWAIGVDGTGLQQLTTGSSDLSPDWGSAQVAPPPPPPAAPTIQIFSPVDGATYLPGMQVSAIYFCTSIDPYLAVGCHGDLPFGAPLDLGSAGAHRFTVETIDELGRTASASVTYFVADLMPPVVDLRVPKDGAVYSVGAQLTVDYSCADPNGVGVALCQGSLPPGAPLDTSHAGTYTFTVSTADKALNFRQVTATYTVVGRTPQSISFASIPNRSYGDPPFVVGAIGGGSGNPVNFTASGQCTGSGSTVTITGAGTCTVTAHQDGNANYQPAPDVSQTFTIARAGQAISFASLSNAVFGDAPFAISASGGGSGNPVSFAAIGQCTLSAATVTITGAGTCAITAHQSGDGNYQAALDVTQSFSIAQAGQTIIFDPLPTQIFNQTGDTPDFTVSATARSGLNVGFAAVGVCTIVGADTVHLTGVGSCTITASQPGNANYRAAPGVQQQFTVLRAFVMGPQALEGDLKVAPGTTISAGYDFAMPGQHPAASVTFTLPHVVFVWTCVSASGTGSFNVSMLNSSYSDPANTNAWYPSGDHSSSLVYQGSFIVPDYCHGGQVRLKSGGTFLTGIMSTDHTDKVSVRWHYNANGGSGGWSAASSIVPDTG